MPKSQTCSTSCRRRGLTLIEVTAGILILSTLLVATIVAFQQHVRQIERSQRIIDAVRGADELLDEWFSRGTVLPTHGEARVPRDESLVWRTTVDGGGQDGDARQTVRLEISNAAATGAEPALAVVELPSAVPATPRR